jgi:NAD(P)-dependent dehydrogenase (short-subunit alcohol dehydrogenase family)
MKTLLITGASRGIGLEFARQYAADGARIIATCRTPEQATDLAALEGDIHIHPLDVTDHDAIKALAQELQGHAIDVLINNAGIYGPKDKDAPFGKVDAEAWEKVFKTNVIGALKVTEGFSDHVARSEGKQVAILSSKMGSIADNTSGGGYIYRSGKAALNAVAKSLSCDLKSSGVKVVAFHPGWVKTDMGGPNALIDAQKSVTGMRQVLDGFSLEDSGKFINYDGSEIPW